MFPYYAISFFPVNSILCVKRRRPFVIYVDVAAWKRVVMYPSARWERASGFRRWEWDDGPSKPFSFSLRFVQGTCSSWDLEYICFSLRSLVERNINLSVWWKLNHKIICRLHSSSDAFHFQKVLSWRWQQLPVDLHVTLSDVIAGACHKYEN
jgi:hypothetical protein